MNEVLVVDLGGTNLRVALAGRDGGLRAIERCPTPDDGLEGLLRGHLDRHGAAPRACAIGLAARVPRGAPRQPIELTNRALRVDADALAGALRCPVTLHNDLAALASALPLLAPDALDLLDGPAPDADEPRLAIAIGTGFGAALLTPRGEVVATEAGHARLPCALQTDLAAQAPQATYESLLSGPGWRRMLDAAGGDRDRAAGRFLDALAQACADLALAHGAWGGVHLAGGVFAALSAAIEPGALRAALVRDRGAWSAALERLPLVAIRDDVAALRGLARLASATPWS